ncbi:MAG: MOSC domain-containing protein [Alphaproteobacteria bacterium]
MTGKITGIYRYPVKSMSAEALPRVHLSPGKRLPHDRAFALAHAASRFDPMAPAWQPKNDFLNLVRHERLAKLGCKYDDITGMLALLRDGKQVVKGNPADQMGRTLLEQFLAAFLKEESRGRVRVALGPGVAFTDASAPYVSVINLASVRDLERVVRAPVDPLRFRANIYFEGDKAWEEMAWVGREISLGVARARVVEPIGRCAATNVNPATAERDLNLPRALETGFGHCNMGVFAEIVSGGEIAVGDAVAG